MAELGGPNIYLSPAHVASLGTGGLEAMLFHELLHNVTGLTDPDLQRAMGLGAAGGSINITLKVIEKCY